MNSLAVALRGEMALGFAAIDRRFGEIENRFGELRNEHARDMRVNTLMLIMMNLAVTSVIIALGLSGALA